MLLKSKLAIIIGQLITPLPEREERPKLYQFIGTYTNSGVVLPLITIYLM